MAGLATPELTERVSASLKDPNVTPWFPDLTVALAAAGWSSVRRACGLTTDNYGTARLLACTPHGPLKFAACLPTRPDTEAFETLIPVEVLPDDVALRYERNGVRLLAGEEITGTEVLSCLKSAVGVLSLVPGLLNTVVALIRSLHLLRPESDEYDVSFSEPHIPFSAFVSVPSADTPVNALRVAEGVVHEAMHLQLTLLEQVVPLLNSDGGEYFSPWRGEYRNARGVLHALYVFTVIDAFLGALPSPPLCLTAARHARERRAEIGSQVVEVLPFAESAELTESGAALARQLLGL